MSHCSTRWFVSSPPLSIQSPYSELIIKIEFAQAIANRHITSSLLNNNILTLCKSSVLVHMLVPKPVSQFKFSELTGNDAGEQWAYISFIYVDFGYSTSEKVNIVCISRKSIVGITIIA